MLVVLAERILEKGVSETAADDEPVEESLFALGQGHVGQETAVDIHGFPVIFERDCFPGEVMGGEPLGQKGPVTDVFPLVGHLRGVDADETHAADAPVRKTRLQGIPVDDVEDDGRGGRLRLFRARPRRLSAGHQ